MGASARLAHVAVIPLLAAACATSSPGSSAPASSPTPPTDLRFSLNGWRTDFAKHSVDLGEIISGGPGKDGIPAIDAPRFESVADARAWLGDQSAVLSLVEGEEARAYPIAILVWHEIVNDTVGGRPVAVTYCPLCNTALVFDRTVAGTVLDFGTTGNLRFSDLVMYDRQTESWWQQATGEAIVGQRTGERLAFLPTQMVALTDFAASQPDGLVLSRETGHPRPYGRNPYVGYDDPQNRPFLFSGEEDQRLPPMERVVALGEGAEAIAFPYGELMAAGVAEETVAGEAIVVFWVPGTASPLDTQDVAGRDIGATGVFRPLVDGHALSFHREGGPGDPIRDRETGSTWSVTGLATAGELAGAQLEPVVHGDHFWFAWAAFVPETRIWRAS